jgi:hypothetical protein
LYLPDRGNFFAVCICFTLINSDVNNLSLGFFVAELVYEELRMNDADKKQTVYD